MVYLPRGGGFGFLQLYLTAGRHFLIGHMLHLKHTNYLVALLPLIVFAGCVSIDSRIWKETVDQEATALISAKFSNRASYRSTGEFIAANRLTDLLIANPGRDADNVDSVFLSFQKDGKLTFTFLRGEIVYSTRTFTTQEGLSIDSDGRINFPKVSSFAGGDGAIGYQSKTVSLFINKQGDLATLQSGGGAGTIAFVIPFGIYARHLAIFPKK